MSEGNEQAFLQHSNMGKPLEEFVRRTQQRGPREILAEYRALQALDKDEACPTGQKNRPLNRWLDIKCFESTRVKLDPPRNYIHANYVDGFLHPKKFICTQGPLKTTVNDFWRMVWQEKSVLILALTEVGGSKCELYFPSARGKAMQAGNIKISQTTQVYHIRNTYDKTFFDISKDGQRRTVVHMLYHAWPDKGIPDSSTQYLNFMEDYRELQARYTEKLRSQGQWTDGQLGPPIIVHCSAGVGRTGTLCALDVITERMRKTKETVGVPMVSIGQTVAIMRRQRHKAVQRPEQYIFLYLSVIEFALKHNMIQPGKIDISGFHPQSIR